MKIPLIVGVAGGLLASLCWGEIEITEAPPRNTGTGPAIAVPAPKADAVTPVATGVDGDTLKFRNGDSIHGLLLSAVPASGVRWRRSDVKDPITFDLKNVGEVGLASRVRPTASQHAVVELTNGDTLAGELVALDGKTLTLKTWFAGSLTVKRAVVQRLSIVGGQSDAVYTGPNSLDEWKSDGNRGAWLYRKAALYGAGSGSIGRDVKLPESASIDFDLAWRGQLYFNLGFGFDEVRQIYNSGGYMVQFSSSSIYLQRYRPQRGNSNMGNNVEMQELQRKSKIHVSVRINKPKKLIALYLDGNLVKQWTESEDWAGKGTGLVLLSQGQGQLRLTNLAVTTWDGRLDSESGSSAKDADLVRLSNGDKVSGSVKSITGGQVALQTSFAEMNVPLERVATIDFAGQSAERARRGPDDVRAFFPNGTRLTVGLEKLDEQGFTGTTENFGHMTATLGAFRRVQFHIYEPAGDNAEDEDWGGGAAIGPESGEE